MRRIRFFGIRSPFILFAAIWLAVMGLVISLLWNYLVPSIFHLRQITFFEGLGLLILCRVLFGGLRGWGPGMRKARWVAGWKDLTPEQRERFRKAMGADLRDGVAEQ
jgi:hypothetical protein